MKEDIVAGIRGSLSQKDILLADRVRRLQAGGSVSGRAPIELLRGRGQPLSEEDQLASLLGWHARDGGWQIVFVTEEPGPFS